MDDIGNTAMLNFLARSALLLTVIVAWVLEYRKKRRRSDVLALLGAFTAVTFISDLAAFGFFIEPSMLPTVLIINSILVAPAYIGLAYFVLFRFRHRDH